MKKFLASLLPGFLKDKIKSLLKKREFKSFQENSIKLDQKALADGFRKAGIEKGDALFIHSSLRSLGFIENGPIDIINALKEVIGSEGTLIFPTFTVEISMLETLSDPDFVFDPKTSRSSVGAITNTFRQMPDTYRSIHPTHSIAAWGKHAKFVTDGHYLAETNFGEGTPFGKFLELNGKVVGLGIDYANVTFYHVYEDYHLDLWPEVYLKDRLPGRVRLENGTINSCQTLCHNPEFHKTRIEKDPRIEAFFREYFEKNDISHRAKIGQGHIWWLKSADMITELAKLYKKNISIYKIE